jgi:hypothetical protein
MIARRRADDPFIPTVLLVLFFIFKASWNVKISTSNVLMILLPCAMPIQDSDHKIEGREALITVIISVSLLHIHLCSAVSTGLESPGCLVRVVVHLSLLLRSQKVRIDHEHDSGT